MDSIKANMKKQKGDDLERAVKRIEEAILKYSSTLDPDKFVVENKKIVIAEGVLHEIDLYVEVSVAQGYKSKFIFECKNWKQNVGKNDIIIFSEKIQATSSQIGFFVARGFSKGATAQAAKDERIELLLASDFPLDYPRMLVTGRSGFNGDIKLTKRSAIGKIDPSFMTIDISTAKAIFNGNEIDLYEFLGEESNQGFDEALKQIDTTKLDPGAYPIQFQITMVLPENQLLVNGDDIAKIHLDVSVELLIHKPRVIHHFAIEGRGKYIELEPYDYGTGHGELIITLAAPLENDVTLERN
jgi:hypothetical protein